MPARLFQAFFQIRQTPRIGIVFGHAAPLRSANSVAKEEEQFKKAGGP